MIRLGHDDIQGLLGVYAADAISDPDERAASERHLLDCEPCREEVDGHLDALARLTPDSERVDAASWAGLAAAIARPALAAVPDAPPAGAPLLPDGPTGAQVGIDKGVFGITPISLRLKVGIAFELVVSKPGYATQKVLHFVTKRTNQKVKVRLVRQ